MLSVIKPRRRFRGDLNGSTTLLVIASIFLVRSASAGVSEAKDAPATAEEVLSKLAHQNEQVLEFSGTATISSEDRLGPSRVVNFWHSHGNTLIHRSLEDDGNLFPSEKLARQSGRKKSLILGSSSPGSGAATTGAISASDSSALEEDDLRRLLSLTMVNFDVDETRGRSNETSFVAEVQPGGEIDYRITTDRPFLYGSRAETEYRLKKLDDGYIRIESIITLMDGRADRRVLLKSYSYEDTSGERNRFPKSMLYQYAEPTEDGGFVSMRNTSIRFDELQPKAPFEASFYDFNFPLGTYVSDRIGNIGYRVGAHEREFKAIESMVPGNTGVDRVAASDAGSRASSSSASLPHRTDYGRNVVKSGIPLEWIGHLSLAVGMLLLIFAGTAGAFRLAWRCRRPLSHSKG